MVLAEIDGTEDQVILKAKGHGVKGNARPQGEGIVQPVTAQHPVFKGNLVLHVGPADANKGGGPAAQGVHNRPGAVCGIVVCVVHISGGNLLQGKAYLGAVRFAAVHKDDLRLGVCLVDHIPHKHARGTQAKDHRALENFIRGDAPSRLQVAAQAAGRLAEPMGAAQVLHALQLKEHAGKGIGENHLLGKGEVQFPAVDIALGDAQEHIGVDIHAVAEQAVGLVAAIFKIGFILGVAGGINAVAPANEHNGKAVFRGNPDNALMTVNQALLSGRKLRVQLSPAPHLHQLMIRTAKAHQHRMHQHALLERFSPQALARRIDQLHLAVHQRAFRIVLKIRAIGFQSHASLSDPLAPGCVRRIHVAFHGTGSQQRPACCASPRHNASGSQRYGFFHRGTFARRSVARMVCFFLSTGTEFRRNHPLGFAYLFVAKK